MHAVRRTLSTTGLAGLLVMAPTGAAWAAPTPTPDPTATASASPAASPTDAPSPSDVPTGKPTAQPTDAPTPGGCDQQPEICQSGGQPETTTDCDPFATSPPPSGVVCIAGGIKPGGPPTGTGNGTGTGTASGTGSPGQLPRTGPAPLLPSLALGTWLLLLGTLAGLAGRRRTARI